MVVKKVVLPEIGEGVMEAEITKWHVKEGDHVKKFQNLVQVLADKGSLDIPSPYDGVVAKILVNEGDLVRVGTPILEIEITDSEEKEEKELEEKTTEKEETIPIPEKEVVEKREIKRPKASPAVRKLAAQLGVPLEEVKGTGPGGIITREDVLEYKKKTDIEVKKPAEKQEIPSWIPDGIPKPRPKEKEERIKVKGIRRFIAERMLRAWLRIPHSSGTEIVIADRLIEARERLKKHAEAQGLKLTYMPFIMKAVVKALKEYPLLNGLYDPEWDEIIVKKYYNIGFAVDTPQGLVVPVIKNVDEKNIFQIAKELGELAERAREGKLSVDDVTDGTFSITNIGSLGSYVFSPIINYPEIAILGVSKIRKVYTGEGVTNQMLVSITFNHMVVDGAYAVRFLLKIKELLEEPMLLL